MRIDCMQCAMYRSEHCRDCLVTALLHPPNGALDIDDDLDPPLEALTEAGLVPVLRFRARSEVSEPAERDAGGAAG